MFCEATGLLNPQALRTVLQMWQACGIQWSWNVKTPSVAWRKNGELVASDHGTWEFTARPLLRAAKLCWEQHQAAAEAVREGNLEKAIIGDLLLGRVAHLLAAMGIEAMLKALALIGKPGLVVAGGSGFYTHNLRTIAGSLPDVTWSTEELDSLGKLGTFIEWAGRYPIPRWDTEKSRAKYDVPATIVDDQEVINATDIPVLARQSCGELWNRSRRKSTRPTKLLVAALNKPLPQIGQGIDPSRKKAAATVIRPPTA